MALVTAFPCLARNCRVRQRVSAFHWCRLMSGPFLIYYRASSRGPYSFPSFATSLQSLATERWVSKDLPVLRNYTDCTWINRMPRMSILWCWVHAHSVHLLKSLSLTTALTFQTSLLLSKEQQNTDYFPWISGKFCQSPEN